MKYPTGGIQYIDCSAVTLTVGGAAVNVTDGLMAEQLRNDKLKVLTNVNVIETDVTTIRSGIAVGSSGTGASDGQVHTAFLGASKFTVTTNDNVVTFTPVA